MKRFFKTSVILAAAMVAFAACNKADDSAMVENESKFKVRMTLKTPEAATRADEGSASGQEITFTKGYLCFVTSTGLVTKVYDLDNAHPATDEEAGEIKVSDLATTELKNIPGTSKKVHLVANIGTIAAPTVGSHISTLLASTLNISSQSAYASVVVKGEGNIPATGDPRAVTINMSTSVARIEIVDVTFGSTITAAQIDGIFINNYYNTSALSGTVTDIKDNGAGAAAIPNYLGGAGSYLAAVSGIVYDYNAAGLGTAFAANKITPTTGGGVWGYNLFAAATPQIIIRLSGITVSTPSTTYADPQFITINSLVDLGNSDANIPTLEGTKVYKLGTGKLVINEEDLSPEPGTKAINAKVTVTNAVWGTVNVGPKL